MQNPSATAPRSNPARTLLTRTSGLLLALTVLLLSFSGAAAPALPTAEVAPPPIPNIAETTESPAKTPDAPAAAPPQTTSESDDRLSFTTGDRLSAEQIAEYRAYIAALKADDGHRGIAVYSSW